MAEVAPRTEEEIINALLDTAGWSATMRIIDSSNEQLYEWAPSGENILQGIYTLQEITGGTFYVNHQNYAVWESRNYRSIYKTVPSATFINTMVDMVYELGDNEIFNHIRVRIAPPLTEAPESGIKQWKRECAAPGIRLAYGYPLHWDAYADEEKVIWGTPQCYVLRDMVDVSAYMTILKYKEGDDWCHIHISNDYFEDYFPTSRLQWLSINYTPYIPEKPGGTPPAGGWAEGEEYVEVEDADSIALYGKRTKHVYVPFPMEMEDAENLANFYLNYHKRPVASIKLKLINKTAEILTQILTRQISDRITVVNTELGLNSDFFLNKLSHKVSDNRTVHEAEWIIEKVIGSRQIGVWDLTKWGACAWG